MKQNRYSIVFITILSLGISGCTSPLELLLPSVHAKKRVVHKKPAPKPAPKPKAKPKPKAVKYEKPTPQKSAKFKEVMREVALSTKDDKKYRKITLDTPAKKEWFKNLMYRFWDRQITKNQFISEGLAKYPNRKYEFTFVANGFQKRS